MSQGRLSFGEYLREAFFRKVRVPLLGKMPANLMGLGVFAVLGLANPGFWLLGAAAEVAYLFGVGGSDRFQNVVDGERLLGAQQGWESKVAAAVDKLSATSERRYRTLLAQCRKILGISESLGGDSLGGLRDMKGQSLNQLLWIFLRLLTSREVIEDNIKGLNKASLEKEIRKLQKQLDSDEVDASSALGRSLSGTLDIQQKRLENLARALENSRVIDAELLRIEQQVELLREEAAVSGKPEALSTRLDSVTATMSETTRWIEEHSDMLGPLLGVGASETANELPPPTRLSEDA